MSDYTFTNAGEGVCYCAPASATIPSSLTFAALASAMTASGTAWTPVGTLSEDGLTVSFAETKAAKNWNGDPIRSYKSGDGNVEAKAMDFLSESALKMVFGDSNVSNGVVDVDRETNPDPVMFCAIMKDGEKGVAFLSRKFMIDAVNSVNFKSGEMALLDFSAIHSKSYLVYQTEGE